MRSLSDLGGLIYNEGNRPFAKAACMVSTFLVAGLLAAIAIGTCVWQSNAWKSQQEGESSDQEIDFYRHRQRRRMQISLLLGLVALAIAAGPLITDALLIGCYWLGVLIALCWIISLSLIDAWASQRFLVRVQGNEHSEQALMQRELLKHSRPQPHSDSSP